MSTVSLIPPDDLDVIGLGSVKAGVPVDVPIELAGRAPDPEREVQMQALNAAIAAIDHTAAQACRERIVELDMGHGLLAQGWLPAPVEPKLTAAEKKAAAEAAAATNPDTKEG